MNDINMNEILNKYKYKDLLNNINIFLNKNLSIKDVEELENSIDDYWCKGNGYKDFSIYFKDIYLYAALRCFVRFSKDTVLKTYSVLKNEDIKSILDYGVGIGLTTNLISDLFKNSKVYYYNLDNSIQKIYFNKIKNNDIEILNNEKDVFERKYDVIFLLELFEHIEYPIDLLHQLLNVCNKYLVINNTFKFCAYGHFKEYYYSNNVYSPRQMSKLFLKEINMYCNKLPVCFWNDRPKIFLKK